MKTQEKEQSHYRPIFIVIYITKEALKPFSCNKSNVPVIHEAHMLIKAFCTTTAIGASSNPCTEIFCGYSPESEIEVKNVADFIRRNKGVMKAYLTIHSYSQLLLFPYSYTYDLSADHNELVRYLYKACILLSKEIFFIRGTK